MFLSSAASVPDVLGSTGGAPELQATSRYRVFEAIVRFLTELAREAPIAAFFDDVQNAEPDSLLLLEYMVRRLRESRVSIVLAYRSTDVGRSHPLRRTLTSLVHDELVTEMKLSGLALNDVRNLIERGTGTEIAPEFAEAIRVETGGNPLFIIELLTTLKEKQLLVEGSHSSAISRDDLHVPLGVKKLIEDRVERLGAPGREVLRTASVLGQEFSFLLLETTTALHKEVLLRELEHTIETGFVVEGPIPGDGMLAFAHPLVREAVYQGIPNARRRAMHSTAASTMMRLFADRAELHSAEIAHHLVSAGDLADVRQVRKFLAIAGIRALHLCSYDDSLSHLTAALDRFDDELDEELRASVLTEMGFVLGQFGRADDALERYDQAVRVYRKLGNQRMVAKLREKTGSILNTYGRFTEAIAVLEEAMAGLEGEVSGDYCSALAAYSIALMSSGRLNEAGPYIQKALDVAWKTGHPGYEAISSHSAAIWNAWDYGDHDSSPAQFKRALKLAFEAGSLDAGARINADAALTLYIMGRKGAAVEALDAAEAFAKKYHRGILGDVWSVRSMLQVHAGRWEEADEAWGLYQETIAEASASAFDAVARRSRALRLHWTGRTEEALEAVQTSPPLFIAPLRAWLLLQLGRKEEARQLLEVIRMRLPPDGHGGLWLLFALPTIAGLRKLGVLGDPSPWLAGLQGYATWRTDWFQPSTELAHLGQAAGDRKASERLVKAIERYDAEGSAALAAVSRLELAETLAVGNRPGNKAKAAKALEDARRELTRLAMPEWIKRADALLRGLKTGRPPSEHPLGLTTREIEVLQLIVYGKANREIGDELGLSVKTVERHVGNLFSKLEVSDRTQAAVKAVQSNLFGREVSR